MLNELVQALASVLGRDREREQYGGRIAARWESDLGAFTRP